ncbi:lipopolysaccharide biosynthesis protein [Flavobacterium restrictum]|uniref:Lipopolysaccharide biosynthesis protein n=1 Tax=Flavobacterium restrictum TaxID=2594428 RepID=A0A553DW84_9FLAO|nr:lipopolysaccharide biosynthesis protein [Flavobacterium restrictum]TRX37066.1 lipopolysaccharide biosynthesis protein [Flavobacterium restrictum]
MSLKKQALHGFIWTYAEQSGGQIINFFVNIILARTLFPDDFGVLGILYVFITIANVLVEGGMKTSIIRKKNTDENDYSSVFFANILISISVYIIIFLAAPFISDFYRKPEFTLLLRFFSLTIIIQAFVFVQSAILTKNLDFRKQTLMKIPSIFLSSILGIVLAFMNYGIWSLVWMYLTQAFFWALFHWLFSDWKPKWVFDKALFKFHFDFGYKLTIVEILNSITANIYQIIMGQYYTLRDVGYYTQSLTVRQLPISNIYGAASKLLLPIFSKVQDDEARLVNTYQKMLSILMVVIAPILMFIAFFSEQIIVFLYSEKWKLAAPFLFYLAIAGIFNVVYSFNTSVLSIIGDSKLILRIEILNKVQRFIFIIVALILMLSIDYFLFSILLASIVNYLIVDFYISKYLKIKKFLLIFLFLRFLIFSGFSVLCSYVFFNNFKFILIPVLNLALSFFVGALFYVALVYFFNKKTISDLIELVKK